MNGALRMDNADWKEEGLRRFTERAVAEYHARQNGLPLPTAPREERAGPRTLPLEVPHVDRPDCHPVHAAAGLVPVPDQRGATPQHAGTGPVLDLRRRVPGGTGAVRRLRRRVLPIGLTLALFVTTYGLLLALAPDFGPQMPGWQRVLCAVLPAVACPSLLALITLLTRKDVTK
ncbi:hypothetical protein GO986_08735 [Deinococcus sp. HMF7620]|uniref:Uncharacterized protein n=1 Tax=Deinococcus arboris TaxID=2682977 RepID=A0A7C9HYA4_9DEIO|nr:hypothetical protein [Deinococcus arboris]MVN86848.1 hypothetical protein [Deinococcus arboris]